MTGLYASIDDYIKVVESELRRPVIILSPYTNAHPGIILDNLNKSKDLNKKYLIQQMARLKDLINRMDEYTTEHPFQAHYDNGRIDVISKKNWPLYQNSMVLFEAIKARINLVEEKALPATFKDIFLVEDYRKYIDALASAKPPLIKTDWSYINQKGSKGVICSWIKFLQSKGIVLGNLNRENLSVILSNEIKGLNLGKSGRTFDDYSQSFDNDYKEQLKELLDM